MSYAADRALWLEFEEQKAMKQDGKCRHCGIECAESICALCDKERVGLFKRFAGRAGSNAPRHRQVTETRTYRFPYAEDQA